MEENQILDTSVAIEKEEGTITLFTVIEYPPSTTKLFQIIIPEGLDYLKAVEVATKLRAIGKPIGAIDIIIAAMCLNRSAKLVTKDSDFKYVKEAYPEFNFELIL
ncbi:MAG: PIN domain-containing protein [Candidatus Aenigmarchaeota archaeon]|nr:PIN domain-containing protein [Candidatus Aenigmarchaeota archaeon]